MPDTTAVYRAVADFSSLKRQADAARRSLRRLRTESSDTHEDYVAGQEEVTEATDDSTTANTKLTRVLGRVTKATSKTVQAEESRVDVLKDTVAQISKQSAAQREHTRLEVEATRAREKLVSVESDYQRVAEQTTATDEDRAKALDNVRLASIAAAAANDRLQSSMARLAIGGGGRGGRPRGPGIATDVGAFGRAFATVAAGALSTLLLVVPTINTIIAGVVGLVALLGSAVVAATAFAAAFVAVAGAMAIAAYRWRALLSSSTDGVSEWKGAILAIEAAAFNMLKSLVSQFDATGEAGVSMWDKIVEASFLVMQKMAPVFEWIIDKITNFIDALSGTPGAFSPFLEFIKTWIDEWKILKDIVNEDILPGGVGFFEKYEAPAKAFVEGIARVINGIRKFSRMGLGLNMDQLAEFITNVFDALAKLIQIIPRYSNALVTVGLATSEWLNQLIPIIDIIFRVGEVILKDFVAPLVTLAGAITTLILRVPIIKWLTGIAGGFVIAAFAISKLTFGLIKFKDIITGRWLVTAIGLFQRFFANLGSGYGVLGSLAATFPRLGSAIGGFVQALGGLGGALIFSGGVVAAVSGGIFLISKAMEGLAEMEARTEAAWDSLLKKFADGHATLVQTREDMIKAGLAEYHRTSILGKMAFTFAHAIDMFKGQDRTEIIAAQATDRLGSSFLEMSQNATAAVLETGELTDEQIKNLKVTRDNTGGMQYFVAFLHNATEAYEEGTITLGQYNAILDQLGVSAADAGSNVDIMALKVQGASNTIAEALLKVDENATLATGGLGKFATAIGEDVTDFTQTATEAFNDLQGGLLGTGEAVTKWFQDTANSIAQWKQETADAFNFVKDAFSGLADNAKITFEKIRDTLQDAIINQREYNANWRELVRLGASKELLQQVKDLGISGGAVIEALVSGGRKGIDQIDEQIRKGGDLAGNLADSMASALGVTMEKLTAAVELFISKMLGIPVDEVRTQVDRIVENTNKATGKVIPLSERIRGKGPEANMRRASARQAETYVSGLQAQAVTPPGENTERQMRSRYEAIGRAGGTGMAVGLAESTPEVKQASLDLADGVIEATKTRFGIKSPSKVFISLGKQVVAGFQEGITDPKGWNSAIGAVVSTLTGLRNTISEIFTNARSWLGGIIEAFKTLYRVISEDLTPAVDDLKTALDNLPDVIDIALDLDTSKAEAAAATFLEKMEKKGLIFQTNPTGGPRIQHEGGPAGHSSRFATGRPRSDEVDARLQKGEYVFSRKSVESMGGLGEMDAFHSFLQGKRLFHRGGPVDESEETSAKIRRLAQSFGFTGATATAGLPKQDLRSQVSVSAPGAGKTAGGLTAAAANYMAVIKKNFPQITGYGTIAVRNIAGTSTWSQHAYGNAIDVMTGSSTALRQAVAFFSNTYRRVLKIAHLLADPWFRSPLGDHYNHVHADFFPQYGGTPPGQPYRSGGKVRKRGGRVHQNEFVLREGAAAALGTSGLDYLNTHADRYGPAAFLEAFNRSFATTTIPQMGGGLGIDGGNARAMFNVAMVLDGKTVSRSVDVHSREARILLPGR